MPHAVADRNQTTRHGAGMGVSSNQGLVGGLMGKGDGSRLSVPSRCGTANSARWRRWLLVLNMGRAVENVAPERGQPGRAKDG